jgi:hypothetical protein
MAGCSLSRLNSATRRFSFAFSSWELRSDTVDLHVYVDDAVRITEVRRSASEDAPWIVTDVVLVATSCWW